MSVNHKNFKKVFPFYLKYLKNRKGVLIADRIQTDANLRSLLVTQILNNKFKYNSYLLSDVHNFKNIPIYDIVSIKKFSFNLKKINLNYFFILISSFFNLITFYFTSLFIKNKFNWLIKNFKCKDINIGDLIYDLYIRYDLNFKNPSIYEKKFFKILFSGILKTHYIDFLVKKYKIKILVSTQISYTSYGNLFLRYGTKLKLKTFLTGYNFIKKIYNHKESLSNPLKIKKYLLKDNIKKISNKKIERFYNLRKAGKIYGSYVPASTMKKVYSTKQDSKIINFLQKIKKIKKKKQVNLFATHCFADSPHLSAGMIFRDYYDQFLETINFFRKNNTNSYWIIKPHPARSEYNEQGVIEEIVRRYKSELENVIICPENINNTKIFQVIDNLINGVSTISIEFACHGKKSIITGDAPFSYGDLFFRPKHKKAYFYLLKNLDKLQTSLSKQQIILSKRILYILELQMLFNVDKSTILPDGYLSENLKEKEYIKKLNINVSSLKNYTIFNDPLYKDLETKLSKLIL